MKDWTERSQITDDVVCFRYVSPGLEQSVEEVFIWDLDKTYLDTSIDSLAGLFAAALERGFNKKNVPGTGKLLTALNKDWTERRGQSRLPLYFISASPPQMEEKIVEKFSVDGVKPFGCFYKDNLRNLTPKRWWRLTKQVGYKLQALLMLRAKLRPDVKQIFWGDDSESDAVIYNLYSDICSRRLGQNDIRFILRNFYVTNEQTDVILDLQSSIPENDPVEKIYINLAVDTDPDYYLKFGRRTLPTYNTFQVACDLLQNSRLSFDGVFAVAQDMVINYDFSPDELLRSFDDLIRRQALGVTSAEKLITFFTEKGLFEKDYRPTVSPLKESLVERGFVFQLEGHFEPWVQERIDYIHDYR